MSENQKCSISSTPSEGIGQVKVATMETNVQVFRGEYDDEGVHFYQAFNDKIADFALENQKFGGPDFNPTRMTWIKPSFAWMLYRAGYGRKSNQNRVLKIKLSHETVAELLSHCKCNVHCEGDFGKEGEPGKLAPSNGRVQWDPERDLFSSEANGRAPRKMLHQRAIQIGLAGPVSEKYAVSPIAIEDVSALARAVGDAHKIQKKEAFDEAMAKLIPMLPQERPYMPKCEQVVLKRLGLIPGEEADALAKVGKGLYLQKQNNDHNAKKKKKNHKKKKNKK